MLPSLSAFDDRSARNGDRALLALLLLTALTWAIGLAGTPYEAVGTALIDERPGQRSNDWDVRGERINISVDARGVMLWREMSGRSQARRTVELPPGKERRLRVDASIETRSPPPFGEPLARPLLTTRFIDESGDTIFARSITAASALRGITEHVAFFEIPDAARRMTLVFTNRDEHSAGTFRLIRVRVDQVGGSELHLALGALLVASWLVLGTLGTIALYRRGGLAVVGAVGTMVVLVAVGVMLPENATSSIGQLRDGAVQRLPALEGLALVELFKAGHFVFFFVLGLVTFRFRGRLGLTRMQAIGLLALLALASEGAQLFFDNRTPRLTDVIVDGAGILLAAALIGNRQRRRLPS